jgi:Lrp/AsnC family transcriptional regulator, regulator for asnA, asnC and gidA
VKIIKDLLKDGRKNFSDIAKECQVTSATIGDRYQELVNAGIIVGATLQANYETLGYEGIATLQLNVESQHTNEIFERLQKNPNILVQRQYNVEHNIMVISRWKKLRELDTLKETIRRQNAIVECKTYLWTDVRNTPENLAIKSDTKIDNRTVNKLNETTSLVKNNPVEIDEVDRRITEKLFQNGRMPFRRIAQELGISTTTVSTRYQKLKDNNIIKVSIQINPTALGYQAVADFSLAFTNQNEINQVIDELLQIPNVSYIVKVEGDFDLHVTALVKDLAEVFSINKEITKIPNIKKLETALRKTPPAWPGPGQHISTFN